MSHNSKKLSILIFIVFGSISNSFAQFDKGKTSLEANFKLNVASWNIRQASKVKFKRTVNINGQKENVLNFFGDWFESRDIDVLAIQEFQDKKDIDTGVVESPLDVLGQVLPSHIQILKGLPIREPTLRGKSNLWEDYCPIFYNAEKLNCESPAEGRIQIGIDYALGPNSELISTIQTPRYVNWAYCESKDQRFDFVVSCVHVNYKIAETHIKGLPKVISEVLNQNIKVPQKLRNENKDFIFLGDFNLDRRTGTVYQDWGYEDLIIDPILPLFPKGTRWKKAAFTKLKDIYTFTEARKRSVDIYDDVVHTFNMSESLVSKYVDPLIDDFFINPTNNRVDMRSLLTVSDHLPVIATFDLSSDTD